MIVSLSQHQQRLGIGHTSGRVCVRVYVYVCACVRESVYTCSRPSASAEAWHRSHVCVCVVCVYVYT